MSGPATHGLTEVKPTLEQKQHIDTATVAFMNCCPFYAHLYYSIGKLVCTKDVPTAATDGRHIVINPDYVCKHTIAETVFILAHEMSHLVGMHPARFKHYGKQGTLRSKPWIHEHANVCADLVINHDLVETICTGAKKGASCNPDWLYDPNIKGSELWEDVYERTLKVIKVPPPPGQGKGKDGGQPGTQTQTNPGKTFGQSEKAVRGLKGDGTQGSFDQVLDPPIDPGTQRVDLPDESEFREAVARAAAAAKAMGNMPAQFQRLVDEILQPKVNWRDHIRMLVTGKIGARGETWARPNRRRLVLNPIVIMPGRRGYGANRVVVAVDSSGSIGADELRDFFTEINGILTDCKPREIVVIGCDARVTQVDTLHSLDEFEGLRAKGVKGGGGTSFVPVFDYVREHELRPETLVYLTDMMGTFPDEAPGYPVIWAATTDHKAPWGEVVRVEV